MNDSHSHESTPQLPGEQTKNLGASEYAALVNLPAQDKLDASESAMERVLLEDAARLVATVANNEAKALTFAAMALKDGRGQLSSWEIYQLFVGMQGEQDPAWADIGHGVPGQYTRDTFVPVGAVAKNTIETNRGFSDRYEVTKYGDRMGLAVVGMMLDLSLEHPETSLYELFGATSSKSKEERRSPQTRLEILDVLIDLSSDETLSIAQLSRKIGYPAANLVEPVRELERVGLVDAQKFVPGESDKEVLVSHPDKFKHLPFRPDQGPLPSIVHQQLTRLLSETPDASVNIEDLIRAVEKALPPAEKRDIRERVHSAVEYWQRSGAVESRSIFSHEQRSFLRINPDKRELANDLLIPIRGIMEGDQRYLDWGRQRAKEILGDASTVNKLLERARETSPYKARESQEEFQARVMAILSSGETTADQIFEKIEAEGKPTSIASVRRILRSLAQDGRVAYREVGGKKHYRPS